MRIAIVGYGKMGKTIEQEIFKRGHTVSMIAQNSDETAQISSGNTDVAIEFTTPESAFQNCISLLKNGVKVVSGTTGWNQKISEIRSLCTTHGYTFLHSSNFSIGVNLFFKLNEYFARMMEKFPGYSISLSETHHIHKKDKPSGTAITLAEKIISNHSHLKEWQLDEHQANQHIIPISVTRKGEVPGTHFVQYQSENDIIELKHEAKGRQGFASGAVAVAEWIVDKKGFLTMDDFMDQ